MPLTPTSVHNRNSITSTPDTTQAQTPSKPLSTKDEQILNALGDSLPFFDASDYGVKSRKGSADTPPVASDGARTSSGVKDFFKSIGKAIVSGFAKIGEFFKSLGKSDTPPAPTRYGDTNVPLPNMHGADLNKAGGQLAYAFAKDGEPGLTKMVGDIATKLQTEMQRSDFQGTIPEFIQDTLKFDAAVGYTLEGQLGDDIRALIPELKVTFADNPTALAVLDAIDNYDFAAHMQKDFTKQIDDLAKPDNPLGTFLRSNNTVSIGLFAMARADGFDMNKMANNILTPHMGEMADLQKSLNKLPDDQQKKEVLTGKNATRMMDLTQSILGEAFKTDRLIEAFGEEHIERLNLMAQQVADRDDLPVDVRNQAIETIYIDQLFLRGTVPALFGTAKPGSAEFTAVQLAQSIVNGASGDKFVSQDMRDAYTAVAADFRQNFVASMIELGMPVVS